MFKTPDFDCSKSIHLDDTKETENAYFQALFVLREKKKIYSSTIEIILGRLPSKLPIKASVHRIK